MTGIAGMIFVQPKTIDSIDLTGLPKNLPFWLFWVLLCTILFLLVVIFLQNKDLRQKLNLFFSGARRRMNIFRIKARIKREKEKEISLLIELGKKAWSEKFLVEGLEKGFAVLAQLEQNLIKLQDEWHKIFSQIESLNIRQERLLADHEDEINRWRDIRKPIVEGLKSLRQTKKQLNISMKFSNQEMLTAESHLKKKQPSLFDEHIKSLEAAMAHLEKEKLLVESKIEAASAELVRINNQIRNLEESKENENAKIKEEFKTAAKQKENIQKQIISARNRMERLFKHSGNILNRHRVERPDFELIYLELDSTMQNLKELHRQLSELV